MNSAINVVKNESLIMGSLFGTLFAVSATAMTNDFSNTEKVSRNIGWTLTGFSGVSASYYMMKYLRYLKK